MANFYPKTTQELISAVNLANSNNEADTIYLSTNTIYKFVQTNNQENALPEITSEITIQGNNATLLRESTSPLFRFLSVNNILSIYNLKLMGGEDNSDNESSGGAIHVAEAGVIKVVDCSFIGNKTRRTGGAIGAGVSNINSINTTGPYITLIRCIFQSNEVELYQGGAVSVYGGNLYVENCTFENNTINGNGSGSAIRFLLGTGATCKIYNTKFYNNVSPSKGAIAMLHSGFNTMPTNPIISYCEFKGNTGGGIFHENPSSGIEIIAINNDWGHSSGPSGEGIGTGEPVSAGVIYDPFIGVTSSPKHKGGDINPKDCGTAYASKGKKTTGNPISLDDGEKRLDETDIKLNTPLGTLAFTRRYRQSQQDTLDFMGLGWTHDHIYSLVENGGTPNEIVVTMSGSTLVFEDDNADDTFEAAAGSTSVIVKTGSGYDLTASDESVYHFDTAGKLITHTLNNGEVWTYSYDGNGNLTQVSDGYGRSLEFAYYAGTSSFRDDLLWRVGALGVGQTSDLTNTTPTMPYVELDYTDDGNGDGLLTDVQDVRGESWSYRYYGSGTGETDTKWINFLVERFSPAVDRDGDGSADSAITLEALSYSGTARDAISQIVQNRGESLMSKTLDFDPANDVTTETVESLDLTHHFTNGVYLGTEDDQNNTQEQAPLSNYRPAYQEDAKGNRTGMKWSEDGKRLEGVVDANYNETSFSYDSQDRLIASIDAEGRITNYIYEGSRRQPSQILIADSLAVEKAINGDMEVNSDWAIVGTPTTSQQSQTEVSDGDNSWYVDADTAGEGIESNASISFAANKSYLITARVYVVGSGESIQMGVSNDTNWDVISSQTGQWETLRAIHTPSSALTEKLQFLAEGVSAEFYVDSVHVIELTDLQRWQQFVYDDKGRILEEYLLDYETASALQATVRAYGTSGNGNGLLESIEIKDLLDSSNDSSTSYDYDAQGRVIRTNKTSMFGTCQYNHTVYDEAGNVLGTACGLVTASPIPSDVTDLLALYDVSDSQKKHTRITTRQYDEMGRRVATTSNAGTTWARTNRTIYDALGRVTRSIQNYVAQGSSAPGDWVWDETAEEWQYSSSVATAVGHGTELDENIISDTQYNGRGLVNLRRDVIGRVTLYGYNNADRLVKTVQNASDQDYDVSYATGDPDLSAYVASSNADEDIITEQVYDPNGNVVKSIDARGSVTFTVLDALNRPVKVISNAAQASYDILSDLDLSGYGAYSTEPDKDMVSTTEYDPMGRVIRSQRLLENRGATDKWDTMLYGYDSLGRQVRSIQHASLPAYDLSADPSLASYSLSNDSDQDMLTETVYDVQGRVKETIDVNGRITRMVYDGLNRQVKTVANYVEQGSPAVDPNLWEWNETNARWEDGSGNAIDHGTNNDQNIISETVYDSDGRVESTRNVEGLVARNAYDSAGRSLLRIQNLVDNGYVDPAGQLSPAKDPWSWDNNDARWEDGDGTAIARGTNFDQNLISKPEYDDEQRVVETRDARGNLSRQVFDESGRTVLSIANYVAQVNPPEDWEWDETNARWEDGSGNAIDHGTNKDQNRISSTEYDLLGRAFRTRDVAGRETYTVYDAVGRVVRRVQNYVVQGSSLPDDWSWNETNQQYEYSAGNAVDTGTANDQNIISETEYNQAGQVISTRDAFGTQSSFSYDEAGRRVLVTQASNTGLASTSYTCFDKAGRVLRTIANYLALYDEQAQVISPDDWDVDGNWLFNPGEHGTYRDRNIISEMLYDRASRRISSINPEGDVSQTIYFKDGQVASMTDPEGMVTVYRYDALRRRILVVQSYVDNGEDPENWVYDDVTDNRYEESDGTAIVHGTENDQNIIVMVSYDIAGRMVSMRDPRGNVTSYAYDKLGRRTSLTNPLSKVWSTAYAENNGAQQTTMTYPGLNGSTTPYDVVRDFDRFGRLQSIDYNDDSNTALVNFAYDVLGNRTSMSENDGTSDIRITDYLYDQSNRLTQVDFDTDGDSVVEETVSYDYDIRGLRTQLTMPGNLSIVYSYDAKGRLISLNDWDSQESQFKYDALNRHIGTLRPNGMRSIYKLDGAGRLRELRHENNMRETLAAFRYTVDGRGNRVQAQELTLAPNATPTTQTVQHTDSDKVLYTGTWTDTTSFHESTQWDARMALVFVGEDNVELTIGEGPDHSIFDLYVDGTLYVSVDAYAASAGSRVMDIALKDDGWHGLEIRNRHAKNIQSSGYKVRFASLSVDTALSETVIDYSYDSLSRLIEADYNNGSSLLNYGYDVAGNLVDLDGTTRTFNDANQMTNDGTNTLTYDDNGNLRTVGSDTYTWDRANRLLSVGNHSYVYDGLGNRVQQTVSSVVTDYLNDVQPALTKLLKQTTGANVEQFIHAPRGIHAVDDGTDWNFYANDGLGSVRATLDDAGVVQQSMSYDPYGIPLGTTPADFGFTGEQTDASGLNYRRARYYEPQLGTFIKQDLMETPNRYAYVSGNPVNRVDPTGLFDEDTCRVEHGDYMERIAIQAGVRLSNGQYISEMSNPTDAQRREAWMQIAELNPYIENPSRIRAGQRLAIPEDNAAGVNCPVLTPSAPRPSNATFDPGDCLPNEVRQVLPSNGGASRDMTPAGRCEAIRNYVDRLITPGSQFQTGCERLVEVIRFANSTFSYSSAKELTDDISCAITGNRGPFTVYLNVTIPNSYDELGAGGWVNHLDDGTSNQAYHFWSNLNSAAQGAPGIVAFSNYAHECLAIPNDQAGASMPDILLTRLGALVGQAINLNSIPADDLAELINQVACSGGQDIPLNLPSIYTGTLDFPLWSPMWGFNVIQLPTCPFVPSP